jgi:aspartyl-tRNA(Asn)/glutamyl-tRNA(Gln) amidotransferase subunit A
MQEAGLAAFYGNAAADPDVVALIEAGRRRSGAEIAECVLKREALAASLARFFERFDLLLAPTAPVTAWPIPQLGPTHIGGRPVGPRAHAAFTPLFNYCGVPACSVPAGLVRGLPVGIQVIGPRFRDGVVLRYARYVESLARAMTATGPPPGGP